MTTRQPEFAPSPRLLLGPGPSAVPERVLRAMASPPLGHLDPQYLELMDRLRPLLRELFQSENELTLVMPGTGTSGMEACLLNLLDVGDKAVIGVNGYFGQRMVDIGWRSGAEVIAVERPWGETLDEDAILEAIEDHRPKLVAFVHAETSTGIRQPVEKIARAARDRGVLVVVDCVTSLGGCPVEIDRWGVDAAYSASQKCLGAPSGLAPITLSERAMEAIFSRKTPVRSFYLDLSLLARYWGRERVYHHTASSPLLAALYEALRIVFEEGLEARFERHQRQHEALVAGLGEIGLSLTTPTESRLPMLNPVRVPAGIDEADVRRELLTEHGIEIGAGLGELKGKAWRIGLMGASATDNNVMLVLGALKKSLARRSLRTA
ncbi:MAG: alanine--glyoxylate aminotransferase family protein [Acidobacteriota bacterium]|nr:MAG: alanine--glyoxylate aminotransferase family protein [Acidobacteriota bacterium]